MPPASEDPSRAEQRARRIFPPIGPPAATPTPVPEVRAVPPAAAVPAVRPVSPVPAAAPSEPAQPAPVKLFNVANVLTVIRVFLVPVVAVLVAWDGGTNTAVRLAAAALFAVAALTDRLDGHLARSRGLITDFGKIADPIADKALILVTLAVLCWQGAVSWWAWIIIAVRELGITALRLAVVKHAVIPANLGGKIKTVVQIVAIGLYILPRPWPWAIWTAAVFMILAVALTVATGVEYVFQATSILSAARTQRRGSIR